MFHLHGQASCRIYSNRIPKDETKDAQPLNPEASSSSRVVTTCSRDAVALRTALVKAEGMFGSRVRVSFDSVSQKSIITVKAA